MPLYEYECPDCNKRFEVRLGLEEKKEVPCPECGAKTMRVWSFLVKTKSWLLHGPEGASGK